MKEMKSFMLAILFTVVIILSSISLSNYIVNRNNNPFIQVEAGQTWTRIDSLDPFEAKEYDTIVVLDIKRDYAKILWNGRESSMETRLVKFRRTLLIEE